MAAVQLLPPQEYREGSIGFRSWLRPEGAPRAPLAVVICPGNPGEQFGCSHAGAPLIVALATALAKVHVPVITFDYIGVRMSGASGTIEDPKAWSTPSDSQAAESTFNAVAHAKEHFSDNVAIFGYSFGSSQALNFALSGRCHAYVSISIGTKVWLFFEDPAAQENLKKDMQRHSSMTCKALYVVGEKDRMSPRKEVQQLIDGRSDGGAGADLRMIPQGVHALEGKEEEVGALCAEWIVGLRTELNAEKEESSAEVVTKPVATKSIFDVDELEATPQAESNGREQDDAQGKLDVPAEDQPDKMEETKIISTKCTPDSVLNFFYVSLPVGSSIFNLRTTLGGVLSPDVELFEIKGMTMRKLRDEDLLPSEIMLQELTHKISPDMVLTKRQCQEAQAALQMSLERPEIQAEFDKLEKLTNGNDIKYRFQLGKTLKEKVYPDVFNLFDLPCTPKGVQALTGSIAARSDLPMVEKWLMLETLMRNKAAMAQAHAAIEAAKMQKAMGA